MSCAKCHKSAQPYSTVYKCAGVDCSCTDAVPRYRICFVGADDTGEAEFVLFERAGKDLVGKSLITLIREGKSNRVPLDEIVRMARGDDTVPREITALIGQRCAFVVSISSKSFLPNTEVTSFQVNRLDVPNETSVRNAVVYHKANSPRQSESDTGSLTGAGLSTGAPLTGSIPPLSLTDSGNADEIVHEGSYSKELATPEANKNRSSPASVNKSATTHMVTASGVPKSGLRKPLFSDGRAQGPAKMVGGSAVLGDELAAASRSTEGLVEDEDEAPAAKRAKL
ncbi:uncharacterized protein LOC125520269 isoform X10 [Triticum urartu]|uniref:Replication factor A C-terminal domain-containing protein n=1 Tax=Triticum urartu TaxID=4572 RepID=A0A8R7V5C5_TRIUA|nr:uncharacterized protein LOC125520269 isoform X10 [Triticum urartu]